MEGNMYSTQTTYSVEKHKQLSVLVFKMKLVPYMIKVEILFILVTIVGYFTNPFLLEIGIGVTVLTPIALMVSHRIKQKKLYKNYPSVQRQPTLKFVFEEDYFNFERLDETVSTSKVIYSDVYMCAEDHYNFYLFLNPVMAYIVDKTGFGEDKIGDVREFLKSKINKTKLLKNK